MDHTDDIDGVELAKKYKQTYANPLTAACSDYVDGALTNLLCLGVLVAWEQNKRDQQDYNATVDT